MKKILLIITIFTYLPYSIKSMNNDKETSSIMPEEKESFVKYDPQTGHYLCINPDSNLLSANKTPYQPPKQPDNFCLQCLKAIFCCRNTPEFEQ